MWSDRNEGEPHSTRFKKNVEAHLNNGERNIGALNLFMQATNSSHKDSTNMALFSRTAEIAYKSDLHFNQPLDVILCCDGFARRGEAPYPCVSTHMVRMTDSTIEITRGARNMKKVIGNIETMGWKLKPELRLRGKKRCSNQASLFHGETQIRHPWS